MEHGAYVIYPATETRQDTGRVVSRSDAKLVRNDGSEATWKFASTVEAQEEAELWFGVEGWEADDLGILFSVAKDES